MRLSTGIILPDGADFKDSQFFGKNCDELNEFLSNKRTEILSIWRECNEFVYVKKKYKPEYFKIKHKSNFQIVFILGEQAKELYSLNKYSQATINGYVNSVRRLSDYVNATGNTIDLLDYVLDPRDRIHDRKIKSDKYINFFLGFNNYLIQQKYVMASRFTLITHIGGLINMVCKQYGISLPKIPTPSQKPNPVVTLPPEFVAKFVSDKFNIYEQLTPDLKYAWEIAATILVTTLRLSDAISLSMSDLHERNSSLFVSKMNKKTSQYSYLPLPKKLSDIYKDNYVKYGNIYTEHNEDIYIPDAIRDVFSCIEEMHESINIKKIGVNGEEVNNIMPIYLAVHPHMLRKTAITTMIYMGVSERHIKFASGHSSKSTSFERYVGHVEKMFQSEFENYYEKLGI